MKDVHKTYAIPVFESVFPTQFDYRGTTEGKNIYFDLDIKTEAIFKYSVKQNKFAGYYKLIPLNILSIKTTANKESNSFSIELLPNYVFIATSSLQTLPENLQNIIKEEEINIEVFSENFPYIYNIYNSLTSELDKKYLVKAVNIKQLVSEMDVVSIYLVRLPEYVDESALEIFTGKRPGRIKDRELIALKSSNQQKIKEFGIDLEEIEKVKLDNFKNLIYFFRKLSSSLIINRGNINAENHKFLFDKQTRENIKNKEIDNIKNTQQRTASTFINQFGIDIYNEYYSSLNNYIDTAKKVKVYEVLANTINNYYKSNTIYSKLMSWTTFETLRLKLRRITNGRITTGKAYSRSAEIEKKNNFKLILDAVIIENILFRYSPFLFSSTSESQYKAELPKTDKYIKEDQTVFGKEFNVSFSLYIGGIKALLEVLQEIAKKDSFLAKSETFESPIADLKTDLSSIKISVPIGGNGISLVMRGHITSISESSSISSSKAEKVLSIRGKGLELPLERSEINFDLTSPKFLASPTTNFSISISTPLEATKQILDNFAPQRVRIIKLDKSRFNLEILRNRGYETWIKAGSNDFPYMVLQGNTVAPSYDSEYKDLRIFTPIHYVSTNLLEKISSSFSNLSLSQKFLAGVNKTVPNGTILSAIRDVVSSNSMYRVYVDYSGELNIQYEPANISIPFSLSLIEPIQEENTISLETGSNESNVTTFVEVAPTSLAINTPSSTGIPAIYGRAVSESIFDFEMNTENVDYKNKGKKYLEFLDQALDILLLELSKIKNYFLPNIDSKVRDSILKIKSFSNTNSEKNIVDYIENTKTRQKVTQKTTELIPQKTTTTETVDSCDGPVIIQKETTTYTNQQTEKEIIQEVIVDLFQDKNLSYIFSSINTTTIQSLAAPSTANTSFEAIASINDITINTTAILSNICTKLNTTAQTLLSLQEPYVCFKENLDLLSSLLVLGLGQNRKPSKVFEQNSKYANYIKKYLQGISITTSSNPIKVLRAISENIKNKEYNYFADFFLFSIPSTDIKNIINDKELYTTNISPELFMYGLRTKTYNDAFIGTIDAIRNKDKFSTFRAEIIRQLNKNPIKTASATIIGNPNYYVGFTTLLVNEKHSSIGGYISKRTEQQLEYEKRNNHSIIGINEIVDLKEFQDLYRRILPKLRGYYPSESISSDIVFDYMKTMIKNIVKYAKTIKYIHPSAITGVYGAYTDETFNNDSLGEYLKLYIDGLQKEIPEQNEEFSNIEQRYIDLILKYPDELQEYQKIFVPQNYLVAQGHIEAVTHSWSFGSGYRTTVNLNYLFPAIYIYLPVNNQKIILGYIVLESPMYTTKENGMMNPILSNSKLTPLRLFMKQQMKDFYSYYTSPYDFVDTKRKLKFLEIYHKIKYD